MEEDKNIITKLIERQYYKKILNRKRQIYIQLFITNRCQEQCENCYLKFQSEIKDIQLTEIIKIIRDIKSYFKNKNLHIDLIGGDPLMSKNIKEIIEIFYYEKINFGIKGNPWLVEENIEYLKKMGIKYYQLSLDGMEKTHDKFRRKGSFFKTITAIRLLNKNKIPVYIKFTISKDNMDEKWELLKLLYEYKLVIHGFSVARLFGNKEKEIVLTEKYLEENLKNLYKFYELQLTNKKIRIIYNFKEHIWTPFLLKKKILNKNICMRLLKKGYDFKCSALLKNVIYINTKGEYSLCSKILNFKSTKNFIEYMKNKKIYKEKIIKSFCKSCMYKNLCMDCIVFNKNHNIKECELYVKGNI